MNGIDGNMDSEEMTTERCKDSGLALVLISLIVYFFRPGPAPIILAILFLAAAMTVPIVFKPFATVWFGLSALMGGVMSKVLLTVLYMLLVLPMGVARRALGKDTMQMKRWKRGKNSVFQIRNHAFSADDLKYPY